VVRPYATPTRSSGTVKGTDGQRTAAKALKEGGRRGGREKGKSEGVRAGREGGRAGLLTCKRGLVQ
jgi:hypothetical protein